MALKKVSLDVLIRHLYEFNNQPPGYMLWLGAGASVTSGVPLASDVVIEGLRRVYAQHRGMTIDAVSQVHGSEIRKWAVDRLDWFDPQNPNKSEYALVMENVFPVPGVRKQFLRKLLQGTQLSIGYRLLGLLLKQRVFDTVLTTNFDHLVRQGVDPSLPQPIVEVNALEQYPALQPFPQEPRLIRLHGDFWHGNLLNTEDELGETPPIRFDAVRRLLNAYGLIVVGYGGWDRSIMQLLFDPLKKDRNALQNGLFWCYPRGATLSPLVGLFLPEDRTYLVEIEGFDSIMRRVAAQFNLSIPLEEGLRDLAIAWEGQSLLADLVEAIFSEAVVGPDQRQEMLRRLVKLLGNPQVILVCSSTDSNTWRVTIAVNISNPPRQVDLGTGLLSRLTQDNTDYIAFSADDCPAEDPFYQVFDSDRTIETFPVWRSGRFLGFVAFASDVPLIEQMHMRLIKTAVRLLVSLS